MKKTLTTLFSIFSVALALFSGPVSSATIHAPDSFLYDAVRGQIVLGTDTVKCGLAASGYTYNRTTQ